MNRCALVILVVVILVGTLAGSVSGDQPKVRSIVFCKSVDEHTYRPITKATVFSVDDPAVYCFVDVATPRDVDVEFEWYAPNGDLYRTSNFGLLHGPSRPDGAPGWYIYASIDVAGASAASMPGKWTVKVVLSPGPDARKSFQLVGTPAGKQEPGGAALPPPRMPPGRGNILFSDDFSDAKSGWETHSDPAGGYGYENGAYFIEVNRPNQTRWSLANRVFTDLVIDVDTVVESTTSDNSYGLICRYQDPENFYLFEVSNDGYYAISALVENAWASLVGWTKSAVINSGTGAKNHVRITCQGDHLTLVVNGHMLADLRDATFSSGDMGFAVSTYSSGGARVQFDNLVVRRP